MEYSTITKQSMLEVARLTDPNGNFAKIAEIMTRKDAIFADMPWLQANGSSFHKAVRRATQPKGEFRRLNEGVGTETPTTSEATFSMSMVETYSEVDKKLVELAASPEMYRMSQAKAFIEGMSQSFVDNTFYGNAAADPEKFDGLATILSDLAMDNVRGAGGTGSDLTSIYIVNWGLDTVYGIYPKGSQSGGVSRNDLGEQTVTDAEGKKFQAYREHYQVHGGIAVEDPRMVSRIANIETSEAATASDALDVNQLIWALNKMPNRGEGAVIYCNSTVFTWLDILANDKTNVHWTGKDPFGKIQLTFRGRPVRLCEGILDTEEQVG